MIRISLTGSQRAELTRLRLGRNTNIGERAHYVLLAASGEKNQTKLELPQAIKQCWERVLGYPVDSVAKAFFEMGGNSLKALKLSQELTQLLTNGDFTVVDVFRYPTLQQQIDIMEQRMKELCHA